MESFTPRPPPKPPRGPLLTFVLILATLAAVVGLGISVVLFASIGRQSDYVDALGGVPSSRRLLVLMLAARGAELGAVVGIWTWKRWGLFAYAILAVVQIAIASKSHADLSTVFAHLVWVAVVMVGATTRWGHFEG